MADKTRKKLKTVAVLLLTAGIAVGLISYALADSNVKEFANSTCIKFSIVLMTFGVGIMYYLRATQKKTKSLERDRDSLILP